MDKARKKVQACSCFLTLHTLARNVKKYTPLDEKTGQPVSEEMRRLLFYVREIERHGGRYFLRQSLLGDDFPQTKRKNEPVKR